MIAPFAEASEALLKAGWSPIPLPARCKEPPPLGYTGSNARAVTLADVRRWIAEQSDNNVAVRMPTGVVGIDVDDYAGKHGGDDLTQLEAELGPLPQTFMSTSREGTRSQIRFFRVPVGTRLCSSMSNAIEVIQPHHRYAVVSPSIHPEGRKYRWFDTGFEPIEHPPTVDDLSDLPWAWIDRFSVQRPAGVNAGAATTDRIAEFVEANTDARAPLCLKGIETKLNRRTKGRHDTLVEVACWVAREAAAGYYPAGDGFRLLNEWWRRVMDDSRRYDGTELADAIAWAVGQADAEPERIAELRAGLDGAADVAVAFDGYRLTDAGNASRLVDLAEGRLRYVREWGQWIVYRRGRWQIDAGEALVTEFAKRVARRLLGETAKMRSAEERKALFGWAIRSESSGAIAAMIRLARGDERVLTEHEDLDANPHLFNVRNGTIDLRTGQLGHHDPAHLLTMQAPVSFDPEATAPLWQRCLERWQPDTEVREYLQREAGAAATGYPTETLSIHYGGGGNGKSKYLGALQTVLGDYAVVPHKSLLVAQRHEQHETVKTDLFRRRLAVAFETKATDTLDDEQVKAITGGDQMRGRRMRQDSWFFWPTHTLIVVTNFRPTIQSRDEAIWRRLRLIPWEVTIRREEMDVELAAKLKAEATGILRWIVEGARRFLAEGFDPPLGIRIATDEYRQSEDLPARFVSDCLRFGEGWVMSKGLQQKLEEWCRDQGLPPMRLREITPVLTRAGCTTGRRIINGTKCTIWLGLRIADLSDFNDCEQA